MAEIGTTYGGGNVTTTARGNDYAYAPLSGATRASLEQMLRARQAALRPAPAAAARAPAATTMRRTPVDPNAGLKASAEAAELHNRIAMAQAMERPAPMRMVTGAGINPGYMMDVNAMSPIQRQLFLAKESTFTGSTAPPGQQGAAAGTDLAQNDPRNPYSNFAREVVGRTGQPGLPPPPPVQQDEEEEQPRQRAPARRSY